MTIKLHPDAEEDLEKALRHYFEIDIALEIKFLKYLELTFEKIVQSPQLYPYENASTQKTLIEKFPYVVLYEKYEDIIMILAIFHTKRNPETLIDRG